MGEKGRRKVGWRAQVTYIHVYTYMFESHPRQLSAIIHCSDLDVYMVNSL